MLTFISWSKHHIFGLLSALVLCGTTACSPGGDLPPADLGSSAEAPLYRIGPGDTVQIFVWRNPELSTSVPVRPDGRISIPLIEDLQAANKTPTELAREIETELSVYVRDPLVTVIVSTFAGTFEQQVRVIGEAQQPQAIPYREKMTLLDVMIAVGGLTEFADGNRATVVRQVNGQQRSYHVRLDDLMRDGEINANVAMLPGDVLIIPQSFF